MHRVRYVALMVGLALSGCSTGAEVIAPPETSLTAPTTTSPVTSTAGSPAVTSTAPTTTTSVPTTTTTTVPTTGPPAATVPPTSEDLGTCRVMGPSAHGWEIVLDLQPTIGPGTYLIDYALRDADGAILETVTREIGMHAEEVLSYWDSLESGASGVVACDIRRIEKDREVCVAGRGCTLTA
jgi:uncharacterized protein YceK